MVVLANAQVKVAGLAILIVGAVVFWLMFTLVVLVQPLRVLVANNSYTPGVDMETEVPVL